MSASIDIERSAPPTSAELAELAEQLRFALSAEDIELIQPLAAQLVADAEQTATLAAAPAPALGQRGGVRRASASDDPLNAIVHWCDVAIEGADGLLAGLRIALKDCIAVAGVPLTAGSSLLDGFVPQEDSAVARRVLESGGRIVATTNMDCIAWSGYGDTSVHGATVNPLDPTRTAGGSSGGSAVALSYEGVDGAFGCDQGGSVRKPAAYVGAIGLKATYGLIPYTRILGIDQAVDHVGPMGRSAKVVARLLDATAGHDGEDPRQAAEVPAPRALRAVEEAAEDLSGLRVAVVSEGIEGIGVEERVAQAFWAGIDRFRELGATIEEVSIPTHLLGGGIALTGCAEGGLALLEGGLNGYQWRGGSYWPEVAEHLARTADARAAELSINAKVALLAGAVLRRQHAGAVYGVGHNLHARIRGEYEEALAGADVLAMPTTPGPPHTLENELTATERIMRGWADGDNTAPTNVTGHPAISLPAAECDGLPVGVMLVAPFFAEERLLAIARTLEATGGWKPEAS